MFSILRLNSMALMMESAVIYASKKLFQSSLSLQVLEALDISEAAPTAPKRGTLGAKSFRPFGDVSKNVEPFFLKLTSFLIA